MKKIMLTCFLLAMLFSLTACAEITLPEESEMSEILEIKSAKMPMLEGMNLQEAEKILSESGFQAVVSNADQDLEWDKERWVVVEQNIPADEETLFEQEIQLTCKRQCQLYLDLKSNTNLIFNVYDVSVTFDGQNIGTIPNGQNFSMLLDVMEGNYELVIAKVGDATKNNTTMIAVTSDMTYQCTIEHGSTISFAHAVVLDGVSGSSLEVSPVEGMVLSEAIDLLKNTGFTDVREEPYGQIWDMTNWIVMVQQPQAGILTDKNTEIVLECKSLDEYFEENYVGKNLAQVQTEAAEKGFELRYYSNSEDNADLNTIIKKMGEIEKTHWIVDKARQYGAAIGTAVVYVHYVEGASNAAFAWEDSLLDDALILQENFPREDAAEAIRVAFTNRCAEDVYKADRENYDPAKFHDNTYTGEFAQTITDYGLWTVKGDDTWHVENLYLLREAGGLAGRLTCDITFDGSRYLLSDIHYCEDPETNSEEILLEAGAGYEYLTVEGRLVVKESEESTQSE